MLTTAQSLACSNALVVKALNTSHACKEPPLQQWLQTAVHSLTAVLMITICRQSSVMSRPCSSTDCFGTDELSCALLAAKPSCLFIVERLLSYPQEQSNVCATSAQVQDCRDKPCAAWALTSKGLLASCTLWRDCCEWRTLFLVQEEAIAVQRQQGFETCRVKPC